MKRREFLKLLGLAGLGGVGQFGCASTLIRSHADSGLTHCYVCGEVTDDSALVWLRAEPGSRVALHYGKDPSFAEFSSTELVTVDPQADSTAIIPLDELEPATRYYYRALVAGKKPGPVANFITAPRPDDNAKVSFCFSGDTRDSYKPFMVMNAVHLQRPDFFMHLGDTIYADINGTARQLPEFWAKYRRNREDLSTQGCFCETSVYATWDDHEVVNDFGPGHHLAPIGRKAFSGLLAGTPPRRRRRHGSTVPSAGAEPRRFLSSTSASIVMRPRTLCLARRKSGGFSTCSRARRPHLNLSLLRCRWSGGGGDRWDGYPKEREEILTFIKDRKIRGVVFMSADMHCAAITKIPKSGGLKDITAGPIAAPVNRITNGTAARFEYFLAENFNFAKITIDPKIDPRKAVVEFIDQDNQVFHTVTLRAG